jgi:hypothetical protein
MTTITLGFKAFDAHELLCHFVAVSAGLYRSKHLDIELIDITFVPDTELPDHVFQASCGAALASAVRGLGQKIVLVAVDRPMFWIWSRTPLDDVSGLAQRKLATFPVIAPPHRLANIILQKAGVDVANEMTLLPARDDVARLGLLRSGNVDAAVISSAIPPARMAALGFHRLCFFGDELRIPTTGLAVEQAQLRRAPEQLRALVEVHKESLRLIHADPVLTAGVLRDWFDVGPDISDETAKRYATAFTRDGRTSQDIAQGAIDAVCDAMDISSRPAWDQVYTFG